MKHGIVGRCTDGWFMYQGWPTVARDKNGTLYAAASGHRLTHVCPFGKDLMYVSHDEGETWSAPQIVNDTKLDDRDPGLVCWGDGNMLLSWFNNTEEIYTAEHRRARWSNLSEPFSMAMLEKWKEVPIEEFGSFTRISHDYGKTWSAPRKAPVTAPHGPIRRADGSFLYVGTERLSDLNVPKGAICAVQSFDDGATWEFLSTLPVPVPENSGEVTAICEPHCVDLGNNEILAAVRCVTDYHEDPVIRGRRMTVYTCRSLDGGKTWQEPVFAGRYGAPPHFMIHSSGALILSVGKRVAPFGQYVRVSYDKGHTWTEDVMISPESSSTDQGYPSTVELSNGDLLTVYYQRYADDDYCSILYTRWNLSDLKK